MEKETLISQNETQSLGKYLDLDSDLQLGLLGHHRGKMEGRYKESLFKSHKRSEPGFGGSLDRANVLVLVSKRLPNLQIAPGAPAASRAKA